MPLVAATLLGRSDVADSPGRPALTVAAVGDINGDGFTDFAVSDPHADVPEGADGAALRPSAGRTAIVFGAATGLPGQVALDGLTQAQGFTLNGAGAGDMSGLAVTGVGDVNGDGIDDVLISAPFADHIYARTYTETYSTYAYSTYTPPSSGYSRSIYYTANGGSYDFYADAVGPITYTVTRYVTTYTGEPRVYQDLVTATRSYSETYTSVAAGRSYLIFGTAAGLAGAETELDLATLTPDKGVEVIGARAQDQAGSALANVGDVTGDGLADLAVAVRFGGASTTYTADPAPPGPGSIVILPGTGTPFAGDLLLSDLPEGAIRITNPGLKVGSATYTAAHNPTDFGISLDGGGDFNGDGVGDLIIGAPGARASTAGAALEEPGAAYIVFGAPASAEIDVSNMPIAAGFRFVGAYGGDGVGQSVASVGDINGDMRDDFLVAAPFADAGATYATEDVTAVDAGKVYVLFGQTDQRRTELREIDLLHGVGFTISGTNAGGQLGQSLAGAGDFNGDGINDIALLEIAALDGASGGGQAVRLHVVFGGLTLPTSRLDLALLDGAMGVTIEYRTELTPDADWHPPSIDAADINGDGFTDLIFTPLEVSSAPTDTPLPARVFFGAGTETLRFLDGLDGTIDGVIDGERFDTPHYVGTLGDDAETGDGGRDLLYGRAGNDTLDGDRGADTMFGGLGDDVYVRDDVGDVIDETDGGGRDIVQTSVSDTLGAGLEDLILLGSAPIDGKGNGANNRLVGNSAANLLTGLGGRDTIEGGGDDTLQGGAGHDLYRLSGEATIVEAAAAGLDTIESSVSATLAPHVEYLILTGTAAIDGTGTDEDDVLTGNAAANLLFGRKGDDTLFGGDGDDALNGGSQSDRMSGDAGRDTLDGEFGDDTLLGGAGDDLLLGGGGADDLDGGDGLNTLRGGAGDDVYHVAIVNDRVEEVASDGLDTVFARVDFTLPAHVERLVLIGAAVAGTGLSGDDVIEGSDLDNVLTGNAGDDVLSGGGGDDTLSGGNGADTLSGGTGDDSLHGGGQADSLSGAGGADSLSGAFGADTLQGEDGNDELSGGEGDDSLSGGVGNDSLDGGDGADTLTGGDGADSLSGGAGADTLLGASGVDVLWGGDGADSLSGGSKADELYGGDGDDVLDGDFGKDRLFGEAGNDSLTAGAGDDRMVGGQGNDTLSGGDGANLLEGKSGSDLLLGGVGDDTLIGDGGIDTLSGGEGNDRMTGGDKADTFIYRTDGDVDIDRITDFTLDLDQLHLTDLDFAAQVVDGTNLELAWINGHRLILFGVDELDALTGDIDLIV